MVSQQVALSADNTSCSCFILSLSSVHHSGHLVPYNCPSRVCCCPCMDPTSSTRLCEVDSFTSSLNKRDCPLCCEVSLSAQVLQLSPGAPSDVPPPPPPPLSLTISSFLQHNQRCLFIQHSFRGPANEKKKNLFWWFAAAFRVWQNCVNKALCFAQEMEVAWEMAKSVHCSQRYLLLLLLTTGSISCFSRAHIKYRQIWMNQSEVLGTATLLRFNGNCEHVILAKGTCFQFTNRSGWRESSVNLIICPLDYFLFYNEALRAWVNDMTEAYVVFLGFRIWAGKYCGEIIMQKRISCLWRTQIFESQGSKIVHLLHTSLKNAAK